MEGTLRLNVKIIALLVGTTAVMLCAIDANVAVAECPVDRPYISCPPTRPNLAYSQGSFRLAWSEYEIDNNLVASVKYPSEVGGRDAPLPGEPQKFPLVVYMHGSVSGMYLTKSGRGSCGGGEELVRVPGQDGHSKPVLFPHHKAFDYVLERLARHGFIAVGVHAMNLECATEYSGPSEAENVVLRGRLILKHLQRWRYWQDPNRADAVFAGRFFDRVDLTRIGLAGHSKGGEAVVAAYFLNKSGNRGFGIQALHAIAPTDFHRYVLTDVPYFILGGAADGDADQTMMRLYDRSAARYRCWRNGPDSEARGMPKMQAFVYGANHSWFNANGWTRDDGDPAYTSASRDRLNVVRQQDVERVLGVAFFQRYLQAFAPTRGLFTGAATSSILRGIEIYSSYQNEQYCNVDDFEDPSNLDLDPRLAYRRNSLGGANQKFPGPDGMPLGEYPLSQPAPPKPEPYNTTFFHNTKGLILGWKSKGTRFTLNVPEDYRNGCGYDHLTFRVAQVFQNNTASALNEEGEAQNFSVGLEDERGNSVFLELGRYAEVPYPYRRHNRTKTVLQTVRLPLACFVGVDTSAITKIHFKFDKKDKGLIALDDIQLTK